MKQRIKTRRVSMLDSEETPARGANHRAVEAEPASAPAAAVDSSIPSAVATSSTSSTTTTEPLNLLPQKQERKRRGAPPSGRPLAEMDIETLCDILCPDSLLPAFRRVPTVASEVLQRYQRTAAARSHKILSEMKATDGEGAEDVGVAVEQLAQACEAYVKRYKKRMELLVQYSEDATTGAQSLTSLLSSPSSGNNGGRGVRDWCQRVQDYYARPLSTLQGRIVFAFHVILCMATLTSITLQTLPTINPRLHPDYTSTWNGVEGTISALMLLDVLVIFLANLFDPDRAVSHSMKLYILSLSNCFDVAALILPTIQIATGTSAAFSLVPTNASNATNSTGGYYFIPRNNFAFDSEGELVIVHGQDDPFLLFRLLRVYRMMRALRHFYAFEDLFETLRRSAIPLIGPVVAVLIFVVGFASIVYTMEAGSYMNMMFMVRDEDCESRPLFVLGLETCPRTESKFLSIFHSMWFALISLLTIGFGDMVPKTLLGRMVSLVCIVVGQLLMAMPIAIIGNKFTYVVTNLKAERRAVLEYIHIRKQQHLDDEANMDEAARKIRGGGGGGNGSSLALNGLITTTSTVTTDMSVIIGGRNSVGQGGDELDEEMWRVDGNRKKKAESSIEEDDAEEHHHFGNGNHKRTLLTFSDDNVAALHREHDVRDLTHITLPGGSPGGGSRSVPLVIAAMTTRDTTQQWASAATRDDEKRSLAQQQQQQDDLAEFDVLDSDEVKPLSATRVPALPTLPSVMFCRYLQFATKQQTLDLTAGDRLVVYAVEMYLRHAAKKYLRHNASRNDSDAHTREDSRSAEPNTAAAAPPATSTTATFHATNTKRHLVLVHPDVANVVELATHTSYDIGEDASCELQLRDPLVRALAMSLYSEKARRELQQRSNIGNTSPRRDGSGYTPSSSSSGAKLSSAGRATPLNISLRQSYGLAPTHCNINFWHSIVQHPSEVSSSGSVATMNPAGTAAVSSAAIPSLFLENPYGNTVLVNGQSLSVHGERHLKDGDVIQYSKVCDAVSTTIGSSYAYDVDAVVRGRNE